MTTVTQGGRHWSLSDIPYDHIIRGDIVDDEDWFLLVTASSFVEILSELYSQNLQTYYAGDSAACQWLHDYWEPEEMQHGASLRRYVETVWPDFDWDRGFAGFRQDYSPYCQVALLGPTRGLEMAARCVVETGTASFYTMIRDASPEPVLSTLAGHIRQDEVHHFKMFYRFYVHYQTLERQSRWRVGREIWRRVVEVDSEDAYFAVKNAFAVRYPQRVFMRRDFMRFRKRVSKWITAAYPFDMATKMLMRPLSLPSRVERVAVPLLVRGAKRIVKAAT